MGVTICLFVAGCGSKAYELHGVPAQGDVYRSVVTMSVEDGRVTLHSGGQTAQGSSRMKLWQVCETDLLAVREGRPQRLKVSMLASEQSNFMHIPPDFTENDNAPEPLLGRSILFVRNGNGWDSRLVGGNANATQQQAIDQFGEPWEEDMVPNRRIRIGDSWVISGSRFARQFGAGAKQVNGQLRCRFDQVVDYENQPCALISLQLDLTAKLDEESNSTMSMSGEGFAYRSLATKVDMTTQVTGQCTLSSEFTSEGERVTMTINGPFKLVEWRTKD